MVSNNFFFKPKLETFFRDFSENIISYEVIEEHKTFNGIYERWRIKIIKNLDLGVSYWHYLEKI